MHGEISQYFSLASRTIQWAIADSLGLTLQNVSETIGLAILILRQLVNPSLCQCNSEVSLLQRIWEDIAPTTYFTCIRRYDCIVGLKLVLIIMDYCLLQFDPLNFSWELLDVGIKCEFLPRKFFLLNVSGVDEERIDLHLTSNV